MIRRGETGPVVGDHHAHVRAASATFGLLSQRSIRVWPSVRRRNTMMEGHRRILVVEDDPETAGQLVEQLTTSGYQVDLAPCGNDALSRGSASEYAVITIDRMLPDIDGLAVMRRLRDDGIATPVLIVSALGEVDDRVRGLRAGGDDYLVKPFSFIEVVARVEALGRRR